MSQPDRNPGISQVVMTPRREGIYFGSQFAAKLLQVYKGKNSNRTGLDDRLLGLPYFLYAWGRWGVREGLSRWWQYRLWPDLKGERIRTRYRRWKRRERRPRSYGNTKIAVNRDGDFYLVECPKCHRQDVWLDRRSGEPIFRCRFGDCATAFKVYMEDGTVKFVDHRKGDIPLPAMAAFDPGSNIWRLGLVRDKDYPWWWSRREVCRDLRENGKDGHGHSAYEIIDLPEQIDDTCEATPEKIG